MKLTLIRGIPGSGKTTLAKSLGIQNHFEADMFFISGGEYKFNPAKLKEAHAWCQSQTRNALARGEDVVTSNTFCRLWEMQAYLDMAKEYGAEIEIKICSGDYVNVHGVPGDVVERMRRDFEP